MRDVKKEPYTIIGSALAILAFSLIIVLFLINTFIGNIGVVSGFLLYYFIPALLLTAALLLLFDRIKRKSFKRRHTKIRRIRKTRPA